MMRLALVFLISAAATHGFAQWKPGTDLSGTTQVAGYRYGVGRIEWTFPAGLHAIFAVPHWSAGPRVMCGDNAPGREISCEVQVRPRSLQISSETRRRQLLSEIEPLLAETKDRSAEIQAYGIDTIYVVLEHARATGRNRYYAAGVAQRSTAVLRFEARFGDRAALEVVLDLVAGAKAIDALPMWAWRLGDYRAVCAQRYPELEEAHGRAFAASPFAAVDVPAFFLQRNPTSTPEKVGEMLDKARQGYAAEFDRDPEDRKRAFCEGFPDWVEEAAKGV